MERARGESVPYLLEAYRAGEVLLLGEELDDLSVHPQLSGRGELFDNRRDDGLEQAAVHRPLPGDPLEDLVRVERHQALAAMAVFRESSRPSAGGEDCRAVAAALPTMRRLPPALYPSTKNEVTVCGE